MIEWFENVIDKVEKFLMKEHCEEEVVKEREMESLFLI